MQIDLNQRMHGQMMRPTWRGATLWPFFAVLVAWAFVYGLHWNNDGLWFFDAPGHASNGLFWKDYLLSRSTDPKGYALSYHARYPLITPTKHPPVFYLLEAICFGAIKPSPYVAKTLVLAFALMGGLYTAAWGRRWIGWNAAWAGVVFVLLPGIVQWSHAIMLNVPTIALGIAALYHVRRWLDSSNTSPPWRHLYVGAALAVLSTLTYVTSCVVFPVGVIWILAERRWRLLWNRRTLIAAVATGMALLPWLIVVMKFERNRVRLATGTAGMIANQPWTHYFEGLVFYLRCLPELFGPHLLILAAVGIAGGLSLGKWRRETILLLLMAIVCFLLFWYIPAKESRYILLLSLPVSLLAVLGALFIAHCISKLARFEPKRAATMATAAVVVVVIGQGCVIGRMPVDIITGYEDVVEYLETVAPDGAVFYDGIDSGIFTFHVQARDPGYRRRVVLGRKLLYAEAWWREDQGFVSSPQEVVEAIQKRGGCRWLAVAEEAETTIAAATFLRQAVKGPEFEWVESFPIERRRMSREVQTTRVDVYRVLVPVEPVEEVDMPFFGRRDNLRIRSKPIER